MGMALYGVDAVCMAVLAISADKWEGTSRAEQVDTAVMVIQVVTLLGEHCLRENSRQTQSLFVHSFRRQLHCAQPC